MNTNKPNRILALTALATGAGLLLSGCTTTSGYKQADKTGEGIAQYRNEVVVVKYAVDETLKSMDQVEVTANTDPRQSFERFSRSVTALDAAAARAETRGEAMKAEGDTYFKHWEEQLAQVKNPEIKKLAEERREKLWAAFEAIKKVAEPLRAQFNPWLSDLKDLQTYLSNDLTIAGVDAAREQFTKTKAAGVEVEKSMDALVAELNSIAAAVTPAKVEQTQK